MNNLEAYTALAQVYLLRIIAGLLVFFVGKYLVGTVTRLLRKTMEKRKVDPTLIGFLGGLAYYALMAAVAIAALSQMGIETTSFVAVLGAAGLAVGLALQGSLSNFASGVLIILFRPFKVGEFVSAGGSTGSVVEIGMLTTILRSPDFKRIIVPNSAVMGGAITNFSAEPTRRVDLVFGISYTDDIEKARRLMLDIIEADARILKDPAPVVRVVELADSSVNFAVRPWVNAADYWDVYFDLHEKIKTTFDRNGVTIPFPQRDVHLHQAG
jgi:small conductance mechanosensitive channel